MEFDEHSYKVFIWFKLFVFPLLITDSMQCLPIFMNFMPIDIFTHQKFTFSSNFLYVMFYSHHSLCVTYIAIRQIHKRFECLQKYRNDFGCGSTKEITSAMPCVFFSFHIRLCCYTYLRTIATLLQSHICYNSC